MEPANRNENRKGWEGTITIKAIKAEFIALGQLKAQRHPSILVQFFASRDGKVAYPEGKCTCKASPGLAFCYCFSDSNEDFDDPPRHIRKKIDKG